MKLKEVINGNELITQKNWFFEGVEGNRIFIKGYMAPRKPGERGYEWAKNKLTVLLKDKEFILTNGEFWEAYGNQILICNVDLDGTSIKHYFPEFKP